MMVVTHDMGVELGVMVVHRGRTNLSKKYAVSMVHQLSVPSS